MVDYDASVVGAGPNGLSAAVELARSGRRVLLVEAADTIGGGARTEELTLPGFRHDVCSAIHPSGIASPFFNEIDLDVEWIQPPLPFAHPLGGGRAAAWHRSVSETAAQLGDDGPRFRGLIEPMVDHLADLVEDVLSPMTLNPKHKAVFARVAALGGLPASVLASRFDTSEARGLIAGLAAHAVAPFTAPATSGVGLMLGVIGHVMGWPVAPGGSSAITDALASRFIALGGAIETGRMVESVDDLPGETFLLDVMPPAALRMAGSRITPAQTRKLARWKPGPGVFKVDWALDGPIPWADELSPQAGTVHVGGEFEEVAAAERAVFRGEYPERPFVLLAQQSLFDDTRAPAGKHTAWGYCHVPNGSTVDMTTAIESQIERFAPGFTERIIGRHTRNPVEYEAYNPSLVGGDIGGGGFGIKKILQMGAKRPYTLGEGVFLCSSATPPGAGVHGMCGYHAARAAVEPL
ncbi:MAG: NAD(P)/FAD-dependent oxidoreductase [Actinobacteria bacterium]|nr:NAD(P)/FAD-dependent oxidoreductase [Actinomycetota bacterium]